MSADAFVISYPKSGRTWLRVLLGKALALRYGALAKPILDTPALIDAAGVLRTDFQHDGSELRDDLDYRSLPDDKRIYSDKSVIFLAREPKDVLVSSYFETTKRSFLFDGKPIPFDRSLSEFVRSPVFGVRKLAAFYDIWARNRAVPERFLLVRYEQLHVAPHAVLREILRFLGAGGVREEQIAAAVAYARFDNMRKLERTDAFNDPRLRPGDRREPESHKVRRGRVGGYRDYLSAADIEYIDRELALRTSPFTNPGHL